MEGLSAEPLDAADLDALAAALGRERLPTGDLGEPGRQFFAFRDTERRRVGFAGLEHPGAAGTVALLRSLVTEPAFRGHGIGRAMVEELAARAAAQGVTELYLLTTTAAPFFQAAGFEPVARPDVPPAVAGTREFTSLCPAAAVVLRRRLPLAPPPGRFNIARYCLAENARRQPDKTALVIVGDGGPERRWSFAGLDLAVRRLAGALREQGARPGERLMIRMDNDIACVLTFFAGLAAGLVPLPSAAALTAEEALFLLADAGAGLLAVSDALTLPQPVPAGVRVLSAGTIRHLAETGPAADYADTGADDPAFLIYTSGTTGRPKGVLHAHRSAWGRRPMYQGWYGIGADDIVLHAGAFNWTYTLGVGLIDPWANGATAILYNGRPDPAVWPALIERFGVTLFATVPSLYRRILKYADAVPGAELATRLRSLRHGLSAGEALPPALLAAWRARTGKELFEALGMSEISTYVSTGPGMVLKPGSPGRPQPGRRVAILDPDAAEPRPLPAGAAGLLAIHRSDPGLMLGYWHRPEEEALVYRGDWFTGGDLAHLDTDGYLWYHGRHDDMLKVMGYRLSPLEIEGVLSRHPAVAEAAVGKTAVAADLSVLTAFVVPAPAAPALDEAALLDWARGHLAGYKLPRKVVFLDRLPRTTNGKLRRRDLPRG